MESADERELARSWHPGADSGHIFRWINVARLLEEGRPSKNWRVGLEDDESGVVINMSFLFS